MNNIDEYAEFTNTTAIYPGAGERNTEELSYLALGLNGEAGEVAEKIKKFIRDDRLDQSEVAKELGDVFWYLVRLCYAMNYQPSEVLAANRVKLSKRKEENTLKGSGDNR